MPPSGQSDGALDALHAMIMAHEQLFTYTISFGSFYLFVFVAMRLAKAPSFRADRDAGNAVVTNSAGEGGPTEEQKAAAKAAKAAADTWARETKQTVQLTSSSLAFELLD